MRKLTELEKELTLKGINRNLTEVEFLEKYLDYNKDLIDQQTRQRKIEDKHRGFLRHKKDLGDKESIKKLTEDIKFLREKIKILDTQLNEGVEVK